MRYSYEFKLLCVDLYKSGIYPDTPNGTTDMFYNVKPIGMTAFRHLCFGA